MRYRILESNEYERVKPLLGDFLPHPDSSTIAVAENDAGEIVGCLPLQLVFHMEPLVLTSPAVSFIQLYKALYSAISDAKGLHFYALSDKTVIDGMAEKVGMKAKPHKIYEGEVR